MSELPGKMASNDDGIISQEHGKLADVKQSTADATAVDAIPARSKKSVALERLILCTALFFPLFLATLDTSTPSLLIY